tara:strand:- start:16616 stop:17086 length:471 start_codon:yes stop_codon:yes gene_type:complete
MDKNKNKKDCGCKKGPKITMSKPEGTEFNTPYPIENMNTTLDKNITHNKHYWDTDRNKETHPPVDENLQRTLKFQSDLDVLLTNIGNLLKSKNEAYGNTSLNPPNIFSKLDSSEAICARIDDKIMRIKNKGLVSATEDTVTDLIGYLLLLKMSKNK